MIETKSFTDEQVASMMRFNRTLGEIKELTELGENPIELKRIAFDNYFTATRQLMPDGEFLVDNTLVQVADEIMVERGIK
jgi:hypothetical protein